MSTKKKVKKHLHIVISEETDDLLRKYVSPLWVESGDSRNLLSGTVERAIIEYIKNNPNPRYLWTKLRKQEFHKVEELI